MRHPKLVLINRMSLLICTLIVQLCLLTPVSRAPFCWLRTLRGSLAAAFSSGPACRLGNVPVDTFSLRTVCWASGWDTRHTEEHDYFRMSALFN